MTKNADAEDRGTVLQVRRIGNSLGLILPKELQARLRLKEGDRLHVVEQTSGSLKLSLDDPAHARGMELARHAFRDYADTFRALAEWTRRSGSCSTLGSSGLSRVDRRGAT